MRVLLVRHGNAVDGLTAIGKVQMYLTVNFLRSFFEQEKVIKSQIAILTSPLERAIESAEILKKELGLRSSIQIKGWLDCDADTTSGLRRITASNDQNPKNIIAVSHMPNIESALRNFAQSFGLNQYFSANNGSVHLIDTKEKIVKKTFASY